jgi:mRNA-degrading endonuclease toxin of MazEF toxin-antitoxin module
VVGRPSSVLISQFDMCRLKRPRGGGLVIVLQHDELSGLRTVIVAPIESKLPAEKQARLHPAISVGFVRGYIFVERMAAIDRSAIDEVVGNVSDQEWAIKRAIDIVFFGF